MRLPLALLLLALPAATPVQAAIAPGKPGVATQQVHGRQVAKEVQQLLSAHYVLPELREKFSAVLAKAASSGRYDVSDVNELVSRLNEDLHSVTPDKHLGVSYDPETSKQLAARKPDADEDHSEPSADEIAAVERGNHGLVEMKLLPGNVRYLEVRGFDWAGPSSEAAYDTAMQFLSKGDAVIIDLRKNGGGSPDAVRYLVSHFIEPNKPLMTFYMGDKGVDTTAALQTTKAPRMIGKPLYVLTSGGSASAAEEFIGHVKGYKLGSIIGQNSAGAGFRNEYFALPDGMAISISVGQAILASTGKGWEAVGFKPDTTVALDKAEDVALSQALRKIAASAPQPRAKSLLAIAAVAEAKVTPVKTHLPLSAYAGSYGDRTISVGTGSLLYQRQGRADLKLVAIGPNSFALVDDPQTTVSFELQGDRPVTLNLIRGDGSGWSGNRNP